MTKLYTKWPLYALGETVSTDTIKEVEVLDKDPMGNVFGNKSDNNTGGRVVDTVYVVIVPKEKVIK